MTTRSTTLGVSVARGRAKLADPGRVRRTRDVDALLEAQALLDRCHAVRARLVAMYWRLRERARERGREEGRTEILRREAERLAAIELREIARREGSHPRGGSESSGVGGESIAGPAACCPVFRQDADRVAPRPHEISHQGAAMERFPLAPPVPVCLVHEQCAFEQVRAKRAILAERARALGRIDAQLAMLRAQRDAVRHDAEAPSLGRKLDLRRRARVKDQLARLDECERTKLVERAAAAAGAGAAAHDFAESARAYRALRQKAEPLDGEREPWPRARGRGGGA